MRRAFLPLLLLAVTLTLVSCQPFRLDNTEDYETVVTLYNKSTDFGSYSTFALADERGLIELGDDIDVTHQYDDQIFTRIRGNLVARGYLEVADSSQADLVVLAGVTTIDYEVTGCYYWQDYWCWYYPCYPGGGYCYPYPGNGYTYTVGTVVLLMVDRQTYNPASNSASLLWSATLGGLISGLTSSTELLNNVDQAFAQSPYLTK